MVHWFWYRQTILPPNRCQCSCGYLWTIKSAQCSCGYLWTIKSAQCSCGYLWTIKSAQCSCGYLWTIKSAQCSCGYLWTIKSAWSWQWFSKTLVARPLSEPQTPLHKTGSLPHQTARYQITCRRYQITYIVHEPLRSRCPEMCACMHGCVRARVCVWICIWIFVANVSHTGGTLQISTIIIIINVRLFNEFVSA